MKSHDEAGSWKSWNQSRSIPIPSLTWFTLDLICLIYTNIHKTKACFWHVYDRLVWRFALSSVSRCCTVFGDPSDSETCPDVLTLTLTIWTVCSLNSSHRAGKGLVSPDGLLWANERWALCAGNINTLYWYKDGWKSSKFPLNYPITVHYM